MPYLITIAHAQSPGVDVARGFVEKVNDIILFPIITLMIALALLVFVYGAVMYVTNANNPAARAEGQKHIMWGIIGMLVMLSAFAILKIAAGTFNLGDTLDCADNPGASGCDSVFNTDRFDKFTPPKP